MGDSLPPHNIEFINYCRKRMSRTEFNIFMDFIGESFIGLGDEDEYDVFERILEEKNVNKLG